MSRPKPIPSLNPTPESAQEGPGAFFELLRQGFHQATQLSPEVREECIQLGAAKVKIIFENNLMREKLFPALEHLTKDSLHSSTLTIHCWEGTDQRAPFLPFPWEQSGNIKFYGSDTFIKYDDESDCIYAFKPSTAEAFFWVPQAEAIPYFMTGTPFIPLWNFWGSITPYQILHAGAVGTPEGGVLLVGRGGSGKSSTSATALFSQLQFLSDDYCLVDTDQGVAYNLFGTAKLRPDMLNRFPQLDPYLVNRERVPEEKPLFFLNGHQGGKNFVLEQFPIKALVLPKVTDRKQAQLSPISSGEILRALAPSTIFQLRDFEQEIFRRSVQLVQHCPCYLFELGGELRSLPATLKELI